MKLWLQCNLKQRLEYLIQNDPVVNADKCGCCFYTSRGEIPTSQLVKSREEALRWDMKILQSYQQMVDNGLVMCEKCETVGNSTVCPNCIGIKDD